MRRAIVILAVLASLLTTLDLTAQSGSMRVTVASPTAATLGKFGDVPVSLYTGLPDISIPLFTAQGRTLQVPIVLKYHAGGIRVEEIGGWAGLGWTLEAGGTITRTVRGLVDEAAGGYYCTGNTWYSTNPSNWPDPSLTVFANLTSEQIDGEPDQFFFDFIGRSGQFVMGPTSTSQTIKEYRTIPHQKLLIQPVGISPSCLGGEAGQISSWIITAEDGTRYTFGAVETSTDYNTSLPPGPIPAHYGDSYTSSWHLTGIHSAGGDTVTLTYTGYTVRHKLSTYREKFDLRVGPPNCVPNQYDATNEYAVSTQYLTSIVTAAHTVLFSAGATLRQDATNSATGQPQEPRLDKVTIQTPTGTVLRVFQLEHDYSLGGRLTLKNVYEQDRNAVSLPPYTFTYGGPTLPLRTSYSLDHWGFYNGKDNATSIPSAIGPGNVAFDGADRSPDSLYAIAGALTRITYPTGGYNEFVYQSNDYGSVAGAAPKEYGPKQTRVLNSVPFGGFVSQTFTVGGIAPVIVTVSVILNPPDCGTQVGCPYAEVVDHGSWTAPGTHYLTLGPGTYTMRIWDGDLGQFNSITATWRDLLVVNRKVGGGLRVAELRAADAMGNVDTTKYRYVLDSDNNKSSGVIAFEPAYSYSYSSSQCSYFSRSSMSKMPLGGGPPVGYSEVTVWHGKMGQFGKTRHTFRSVLDAGDDALYFQNGWPFSPRTSHETRRGQETGVSEYNASAQPQRRVGSNYTFATDAETYRSFRAISFNAFSAGAVGTVYYYNPFEVISEWPYMNEDTTFVFDEGGANSFYAVRTYAYGNPVHLELTQLTETNSDGTQRITRMKYPADYAIGTGSLEAAAVTAMQGSAHIHNAVIERWVVEKNGATQRVVQGELTTWREFAPGQFRPYQRFVLNSPSPLP